MKYSCALILAALHEKFRASGTPAVEAHRHIIFVILREDTKVVIGDPCVAISRRGYPDVGRVIVLSDLASPALLLAPRCHHYTCHALVQRRAFRTLVEFTLECFKSHPDHLAKFRPRGVS